MALESGKYLNDLNEQQRAAVEYIGGPELVIAGAGSGKTRVLTYKIIHLLAKGYEPWRILALTFTNKAAREMRERVNSVLGERMANQLWMGTFHSVFAKILRRHAQAIGYPSNFTIYDSQDSRNLVKTIIRDMNLDEKEYKPAVIASAISNAKNALISPEDYIGDADQFKTDTRVGRPKTGSIYQLYRDRMRTSGAMDFDDLLYYTYRLLIENIDIQNHYKEFFRYILVDEYQDTNHAQAQIIKLLASSEPSAGVCVVGDDAQSIYSFRGANLANILRMERAFPSLKMFKLEQNYRSTENIINAAGSLISRNVQQIPKNVFSKNGLGYPVEIVQCFSDFEEAGLLASRISTVKARTGDSYEDFAVLYRTNAQSRILEESLRKRNIPYRIYGGLSFFQRKEVKDVVAYMRLALNPDDEEAIKRIINLPARKIGDTTLKKVIHAANAAGTSLYQVLLDPDKFNVDVNKPTKERLTAFADLITRTVRFAEENNAADTLDFILVQTGLATYYDSEYTPENISKRENLAELTNYATQFVEDKMEQGLTDEVNLASFMTEVSLATDADKNENIETDEKAVTLMTIHAAKGLEFKNVFVVGVETNLLPSMLSVGNMNEIEEERRLLYVAMTRAKNFCMLSFATTRYINGTSTVTGASPFLSEIDSAFVRLAPGTVISAPRQPSKLNVTTSPRFTPRNQMGNSVMNRYNRNSATSQPQPKATSAPRRVTLPDGSQATTHSANELSIGMRILHSRFNKGTITHVDASNPGGARITVLFDGEDNPKTLMLAFAKFLLL